MEYGRYRILNQLGQGGMATVYLAEDPLLQRLVAVKVIQAHLSSNSNLMDRFTVEAKTIASLRHINIVEVFDFGVQDDQQFLVMEYIDGQNLQAVCGALGGKFMPNTVAAAIICQAAEGLTSAEKHGVVHRDIKPENLMFNSEGQLKIADFGIAHIADEGSRTQTGAVLGSPNFMSPEQIEGLKPTNQTDLFSLGGVFYFCLTGKMPFTGPSIPVTMRNICERQHPSIIEINSQAEPFLVRLADTLLQKLPENRGDGARWLANQLRSYLNHHGVVDIVDHVKNFIASLGVAGGGHTIAEGPGLNRPPARPTKSGVGSGVGYPQSAIIRTGSTMSNGNTISKSMAGSSQFNTQATTGAMGPSSRSPVVWIGAFLSVCVLVLAGVIYWTKMDTEVQPKVVVKNDRPTLKTPTTPSNLVPPNPNPTLPVTNPIPVGAQVNNPAGNGTATSGGNGYPGASSQGLANQSDIGSTSAHVTGYDRPEKNPTHHTGANGGSNTGATGGTSHFHTPKLPEPRPQPAPVVNETQPAAEQTGFVLIKSAPPFAALTINGKPQGETPMSAFLEVPLGKCHVEIVHRLSPPFDTTIMITPGFRREFKFKLDR